MSLEELSICTIGTGNTASGIDKVSVRLLKACWKEIRVLVKDFFQACLKQGYFPAAFKVAEVVILPKVGRDVSTPKGWRPVSLLSCLGKVLERLVSKRIALLAIKYKIIPNQLFGALPARSAVDLDSCVIHDVEPTMRSKRVMALATLDFQGAFDAVLLKKFLYRMRHQGWPKSLCLWIE